MSSRKFSNYYHEYTNLITSIRSCYHSRYHKYTSKLLNNVFRVCVYVDDSSRTIQTARQPPGTENDVLIAPVGGTKCQYPSGKTHSDFGGIFEGKKVRLNSRKIRYVVLYVSILDML